MAFPIDAIYARQSLDKQDSISIENQIEFCRHEVQDGNYQTYIDRGFSGKNMSRPAFTRMLKHIKEGKVKRVIVYKLDRISRSILDFSNMMDFFQKYHVEFVSSTEKFDTSTPIGNAMLNISIVFAQLERETIQKRIADAYHTKSRKGFYMGGRIPYGFQLEHTIIHEVHTSRFIPKPSEIAQIQLIYTLYAEPDNTFGTVMQELLNRGFTKKRNASWCPARISEIVQNPVYVRADMDIYRFFESQGSHLINPPSDYIGTNGLFLYQNSGESQKKTGASGLAGKNVVLAPHEGIIDSDLWLKCKRKAMNNRKTSRTKKGKCTWLSGKIKCKKCGYAYTIIKSRSKAGRYFCCSGSRYSVKCEGSGQTIYAEVLENYISEQIKKELEQFPSLSEKPAQPLSLPDNKDKIRIAEIDREIDAYISKVTEAGAALMDYINRQIEDLHMEKQALQHRLAKETSSLLQNTDQITNHLEKWPDFSLEDQQRVADLLINVIYIDEKEIDIHWNI